MENELLTISEYASIRGISKQAVYQQLNKRLKPFVKVVDNKKYLLKEALSLDEINQVEQPLNQQFNQVEQPLDTAFFVSQIAEKDKQIDSLLKQIDNLQELLNQSQRLQAADKQLLLESKNKKGKKGLFALFQKKRDDTAQ